MPIKIPHALPARSVLEKENIFVMTESRAKTQDIRPLKIAIVNLMPHKEETETQLLRVLSNTPLQIEVSLIRMERHTYKHTSEEYLEHFYTPSSKLFQRHFDGLIITGAPLEALPFEEVDYWEELCKIMDWARINVFSTIYLCWGAFAGLYHHYNISRCIVEKKYFGVFMNYKLAVDDPLLRGIDDLFPIPLSRYMAINEEEIKQNSALVILAKSIDAGVTLIKSCNNREIFMTGHLEYDTQTLANEYWRDKLKGLNTALPQNYFPNNNTSLPPLSYWRSSAFLFFNNWLNYYVYQETPYDFAN